MSEWQLIHTNNSYINEMIIITSYIQSFICPVTNMIHWSDKIPELQYSVHYKINPYFVAQLFLIFTYSKIYITF